MKIISQKEYIAQILKNRKQEALRENSILVKEKKKEEEKDKETSEYYEGAVERSAMPTKYSNFISGVKEAFLGECIYSVFNESLTVFDRLDEKQELVKKSLVKNFIQEQGVENLLSRFKKQNCLLAEYAIIVEKAASKVSETSSMYNNNSWTVDKDVKDKFIDDLHNCNSKEAAITIANRVSDAETDFVNDNTRRKMEIDEILQAKKERIDAMEDKPEEVKESVASGFDRKIKLLKNRHVSSVYQRLSEAMIQNVLQDEELRKIYINEGNLDMDTVLIDTGIMYTFLETLFTTEMVKMDYVTEFVNNI